MHQIFIHSEEQNQHCLPLLPDYICPEGFLWVHCKISTGLKSLVFFGNTAYIMICPSLVLQCLLNPRLQWDTKKMFSV